MQPLDFGNLRAWPSMRELSEIRQGGGTEIDQMLALQIAPRTRPVHRGPALRAMLGQNRAITALELPLVVSARSRPVPLSRRSMW